MLQLISALEIPW